MPSRWAVTSFRPFTSLAEVRNVRASPSDACSLNFSSWLLISFISLSMPPMRLSSSFDVVFKSCAARMSFSWPLLSSSSVCLPVIASMRRTPEATLPSLLMRKRPTLAVLSRCVPPQNSMDTSPISTTRTTSPYFSPNMATAPFFFASSMGSTSVTTGMPRRIASLTKVSTASSCSGVMDSKCVKSKRRRSGSTREPA